MQLDELSRVVNNIPPVTRFFTICSVLVCGLVGLGMVDPLLLLCNESTFASHWYRVQLKWQYNKGWEEILKALGQFLFQGYRCITAFFIPVGVVNRKPVSTVSDIYFFYNFANHIESYQGKFKRNFPDCLWFTLLLGTVIVLSTFVVEYFSPSFNPMHHEMMLSCITYIWLRFAKNSIINFFGIVPIKGYYLPLFNLFFKMLEGKHAVMDTLLGIWGGYVYLCLQLQTMPFYNLIPGSYGQSQRPVRRVGSASSSIDLIGDSIYDRGYIPAPSFLYRWLKWPGSTPPRQTAFTRVSQPPIYQAEEEKPSAFALGASHGAFQGKGHRLGGN